MTALGFDKPEFEVKVFYKAVCVLKVKADDPPQAHKMAYNIILDSNPDEIFAISEIEDFFIETSIGGEDGSDMLHE